MGVCSRSYPIRTPAAHHPAADPTLLYRPNLFTPSPSPLPFLPSPAVAIIWSVTASLDKLGVITGPSIWAYFAAQRAAIGLASLAYILTRQPRLLLLLRDRLPLLLAVSALELASVVLFLLAVQHLLVSYVVAIKRSNVLFSVALGALLFGESVGSRMPYIGLMVAGMLLIVLEPSPGLGLVKSHT